MATTIQDLAAQALAALSAEQRQNLDPNAPVYVSGENAGTVAQLTT
jgi:hypothetical protein